jgi:hypothetical protein
MDTKHSNVNDNIKSHIGAILGLHTDLTSNKILVDGKETFNIDGLRDKVNSVIDQYIKYNPTLNIEMISVVLEQNGNDLLKKLQENDKQIYITINALLTHIATSQQYKDNDNSTKSEQENKTNFEKLIYQLSELQTRIIINRCYDINKNIPSIQSNNVIIGLFSTIAKVLSEKIATLNSIDNANRNADNKSGPVIGPSSSSPKGPPLNNPTQQLTGTVNIGRGATPISAPVYKQSTIRKNVYNERPKFPTQGEPIKITQTTLSTQGTPNNTQTKSSLDGGYREDIYKHKYKKYKQKYLQIK